MEFTTQKAFRAYLSRVASLNGLSGPEAVSQSFAVVPGVQQTLEATLQESSAFLQMINLLTVKEQSGEALGMGVSGPIAGRTDTSDKGERETRDPIGMGKNPYMCVKTNFDTHIKYNTLDAWAKFPQFQTMIRDAIIRRQALDRIMIGFNGISVADTSDFEKNPLLQDVNIGWLQKIRDNAPARNMAQGQSKTNKGIFVSPDGKADYKNLDALVADAISELIEPWYADDPGLSVFIGRSLLHDKYFPIMNKAGVTATEVSAVDDVMRSVKQIGGKPAIGVPYFPANSILITLPKNLSIYSQEGARRRFIIDNPKRDRIENYESANDAYVVEDFGAAVLIENVVLGAEPEAAATETTETTETAETTSATAG